MREAGADVDDAEPVDEQLGELVDPGGEITDPATLPVLFEARGEARKSTASAMSSGWMLTFSVVRLR